MVGQVGAHAERVVEVQRRMYVDAALDRRPTAPGMPAVSIWRVQEHMAALEAVMEAHLQWYGPEAAARVAAAAAAAAKPPPRAAVAAGGAAAKPKPGGFGGGGGGGGKKAKGAKGKGKGKKR